MGTDQKAWVVIGERRLLWVLVRERVVLDLKVGIDQDLGID